MLAVCWSTAGSANSAASLAVLLGASLRLRTTKQAAALANMSEALAIALLGGLAAAAVAMIALRSGAPMADPWLKSADARFGLSAQSYVAWFASLGVSLDPLQLIYESSFPQIAASILLLPFLGRTLEVWRLCFLFITTLLNCALISFVLPAYGSFVDATPSTIQALPRGAGIFAFDAVKRFREPDIAVLGLSDLEGVITFPSFHTVMALLMIQAWSWNCALAVPIVTWNLAVIFTTLPIGGHYLVDLVAGVLVWLGWSAVAERLARLPAADVFDGCRALDAPETVTRQSRVRT